MIELNDLQQHDVLKIKLILVGDSECGKTAFLVRLLKNEFSLIKEESFGIEICRKKY